MDKDKIDLLKRAEDLTVEMNKFFHKKGKSVFARYPVMFALLVIFGATLMSQGIKEIILKVSFFKEHPIIMLIAGLLILVITGTLYKKLDK